MAAADKTTEKDPFELDWSPIVEAFEQSEKQKRPPSFNARTPANDKNCSLVGSVYLKDGNILLVDNYNQSLKRFTASGRLREELSLGLAPYDIAMLDATTAAITFIGANQVRLISVGEQLTVQSNIELPFRARGVSGYNGQLAITGVDSDHSLHIVTRGGKVTKTLTSDENGYLAMNLFKYPAFVTCNQAGTVFYVSDLGSQELVAVTDKCLVMFRYTHPELRKLGDVSVDASGNVYVCGSESRNVHQVGADGRHISILPMPTSNVRPWAISFQPDTDNFLLTNAYGGDEEDNTVHVMTVSNPVVTSKKNK
jgi:hypothetical protein